MKIIIPMAGHSKRFKEAGYSIPKPFIMIDGKTMIERVCHMFSPQDEFVFICNEEHLQNERWKKMLESIVQRYQIIEISPHEKGPVFSVLQVEDYIDNKEEPIIISYCDFTMQWDYRHFLLKAANYDGAITVFRGFHPASFGETYYAYIRADEKLEMLELREKRSFTDDRSKEFASTGVYYLDSWETFSYYANELLNIKDNALPEYYCSLLYNPMVRDNKKVCLFEVEKFICWGTPEDMEEYLFWSDYFTKDADMIRVEELEDD